MHIDRVTITGADDDVNPEDLVELHKDFPFVEFGILFSKKRQGTPRYPSEEWLMRFLDLAEEVPPAMAAHLCGQYMRDLVNDGRYTWLFFKKNYYLRYNRIQLNMDEETFANIDLKQLEIKMERFPHSNVILQSRQGFARADEIKYMHMLYDASGGKGIAMSEYPAPAPGLFCGYAGGINPDNILDQLNRIEDVAGDASIWIDAESGVREDNKFSISKARDCLSVAKERLNGI